MCVHRNKVNQVTTADLSPGGPAPVAGWDLCCGAAVPGGGGGAFRPATFATTLSGRPGSAWRDWDWVRQCDGFPEFRSMRSPVPRAAGRRRPSSASSQTVGAAGRLQRDRRAASVNHARPRRRPRVCAAPHRTVDRRDHRLRAGGVTDLSLRCEGVRVIRVMTTRTRYRRLAVSFVWPSAPIVAFTLRGRENRASGGLHNDDGDHKRKSHRCTSRSFQIPCRPREHSPRRPRTNRQGLCA